MKIILASASPRRKELLRNIFPDFEIIPAVGEENATFENPAQYVSDLAHTKAFEVARERFGLETPAGTDPIKASVPAAEAILIIGADTIVYSDGKVLGKPTDAISAGQMLKSLSGKMHSVYTGVALLLLAKEKAQTQCLQSIKFSERTDVCVSPLTSDEIQTYIATGDCFDKAGSYGIQGQFSKHIDHIEGDYFNVVGLPVSHLYREIRAHFSQFL